MSPLVQLALAALFDREDCEEAERILRMDCCPDAVPGLSRNASNKNERVYHAALKLSGGSLPKLYDAIALAQTDDRDLLMATDFGNPNAHKSWKPRAP